MTPEEYRMVRAELIKKVMDSLKEQPMSSEKMLHQMETCRKMSEMMKKSINDGKSEKKDKGNEFETFSLLMRIKKCEELGISYESVLKTQKETLAELIETAAKELTTESLNDVKYKREFISELEFAYKEYKDFKEGIHHGHRFVDLGLPSGTLWADCNVGAEKPEDFGDYFAWGETTPKKEYNVKNYKWLNSEGKLTKYCTRNELGYVDNKTILDIEDDAANANWGGDWHMPNIEDFCELRDHTIEKWVNMNGINGLKLISRKNNNSIFLPASVLGEYFKEGHYGLYWTTISSETSYGCKFYPFMFIIDEGEINPTECNREFGLSIRPITRVK